MEFLKRGLYITTDAECIAILIQKPFTPEALIAAVRHLVEVEPADAAAGGNAK